jgi:hypothetical protein
MKVLILLHIKQYAIKVIRRVISKLNNSDAKKRLDKLRFNDFAQNEDSIEISQNFRIENLEKFDKLKLVQKFGIKLVKQFHGLSK